MELLPAMLVKTITFRRLASRSVESYEVWARFQDNTYASGFRDELLETIENPNQPENVVMKTVDLEYNQGLTWRLPDDMFLDRDHQFRVYRNGFILSTMNYSYNRVKNLLSLDQVMKVYTVDDKFTLEYYRDVLTRSYVLEDDCVISIKPIFSDTHQYGTHNIII